MIINCSAVDISSEAYTRNSAEVCGFVACSFASSLRLSYTPGSISFSSEGVGRWYSPSLIAFRFISISSCFSVECRLGATLSTPHTPSPPPRPIVLPEFTSTSSSGRLLKERFSYESLAVALAYAVSLHVLLEGAGVGAQRGSDLGVGYGESHTSPPTLNARLHELTHGRAVSQTPTHLRLTLSSRDPQHPSSCCGPAQRRWRRGACSRSRLFFTLFLLAYSTDRAAPSRRARDGCRVRGGRRPSSCSAPAPSRDSSECSIHYRPEERRVPPTPKTCCDCRVRGATSVMKRGEWRLSPS